MSKSRYRVFVLFFGGSSYSHPELDDYEIHDSLTEATMAFRDRLDGLDDFFPCVDERAVMHVFKTVPAESDGYPDWTVEVGPRGGVQVTRIG